MVVAGPDWGTLKRFTSGTQTGRWDNTNAGKFLILKNAFRVHEKHENLNHYIKTVLHQAGYAVKENFFLISFVYFVDSFFSYFYGSDVVCWAGCFCHLPKARDSTAA